MTQFVVISTLTKEGENTPQEMLLSWEISHRNAFGKVSLEMKGIFMRSGFEV